MFHDGLEQFIFVFTIKWRLQGKEQRWEGTEEGVESTTKVIPWEPADPTQPQETGQVS